MASETMTVQLCCGIYESSAFILARNVIMDINVAAAALSETIRIGIRDPSAERSKAAAERAVFVQ